MLQLFLNNLRFASRAAHGTLQQKEEIYCSSRYQRHYYPLPSVNMLLSSFSNE